MPTTAHITSDQKHQAMRTTEPLDTAKIDDGPCRLIHSIRPTSVLVLQHNSVPSLQNYYQALCIYDIHKRVLSEPQSFTTVLGYHSSAFVSAVARKFIIRSISQALPGQCTTNICQQQQTKEVNALSLQVNKEPEIKTSSSLPV